MFLRQNPSDGAWHVGWASPRGPLVGEFLSVWNNVDDAMRAAETYSASIRDLPKRSKTQFKNIAPSDKQVGYAYSLGIAEPETLTKARLQDEISCTLAHRRLDLGHAV